MGSYVLAAAGDDGVPRWRAGERLGALFEERCDRLSLEGRPEALAVDGPAGRLTYAELDGRANRLARWLSRRRGVCPGDRIGLLFDSPVSGYVAMLAVLKLHATFVPLDLSFPPDRLAYIVGNASVRLVLSENDPHTAVTALGDDAEFVLLDDHATELEREADTRLGVDETGEPADELCYLIYTSGTTGRPKGVAIGHASICNFVRVAEETYGVRSSDRMYQGLTLAFDFSVEEIWVAWLAGATLVPKPHAGNLLGAELHDFLHEQGVTALCCVPTLLATLDGDLPELRFLLVSGESCPQDLVERWHRPDRRFLNTYGPTEATVSATWTVLNPTRPVTIGVPLPTYSVVILDPDTDRALEPGQLGELGIAGVGLADGYVNRDDLTERAFIEDFLSIPDNPSGRIYRTGDLARFNPDGEVEHHGRIDTQVKVRGYRIELGEIEAVLRQAPGVGQAAAGTHVTEPGAIELVAYFTPQPDAERIDPAFVYALLQEMLPPYMVPAYLERLEELPVMPSGKLDRGRLPAPTGPRRASAARDYVAPETDLEAVLAEQLAAVLGLERVSADSHFFDELGANSLLIARFNARIRDSLPVSMRDVYEHPTVRSLATALETAAPETVRRDIDWADRHLPAPVGTPRYHLCGALQLLAFLVYVALAGSSLDVGARWLTDGHGLLELYGRAVVCGTGLLVGTGLAPIAAKWILIGRFKPARIRVWSVEYLRFWIVKTLVVSNPVAHMVMGTPLYSWYLRALGATVGERALILSHHVPVCTDLLTVGADSVVRKDVYLNGYRATAGVLEIGPVTIGAGAFVGERTVLDIGSELGQGAELGHSSSLHSGQRVPAGRCWHGSPAEPAPDGYAYRTVPTLVSTKARLAAYTGWRIVGLLAVASPLEAAIAALLLTHPPVLDRLGEPFALAFAGALLLAVYAGGLVFALTIPRLAARALEPGRVYQLYGLRFALQRIAARMSNNMLLTGLFGDSVAIPHYLRALGWRLGEIEQTGSNFGLDVKQELPALCAIGTGTMVSDGLSMMNAEFSSTSFRVGTVAVGKRNFLGNQINYPVGGRTGDNCLLATKVMVPTCGPVRTDVGLLGSPCFEIPRTVQRDHRFDHLATGPERRRRLIAKTRHNLGTMALHLLVSYLLILGVVLIALAPIGGSGWGDLPGTVGSVLLELLFAVALFVVAERAVCGFKPLEPRFCSIYQLEFWRHERYWKVAPTGYTHLFDGTPFKRLMWRALGVAIGARPFDDGLAIVERTLVRIGDDCTFNMGSHLQSHTLEDGSFKSEQITVGDRCSIGTGCLVNYGAVMGDGSALEIDSFLMKGTQVAPGARWGGNPATEISTNTDSQRT